MNDERTDSPAPAKRQTQSYLRNLFEVNGLRPKNKLGQNFLIDLNLVDFVVRSAELSRQDLVLEVGTGTGSLTTQMARLAGSVLSIEIDPAFHRLAETTVGKQAHVRLLLADVLQNKNRLNPQVLEELEALRQVHQPEQLKLIANLPYAVATPVVANLLLTDLVFERMVVTVQWEIAARMIAEPSTKHYGALAVMMQSLADVEVLRRLPPTVFWPRPKVESAIVCIRPRPEKRAALPDPPRFRVFLRDLYTHRRKNLRGALASLVGRGSKEEVDRKLTELAIDGNLRAEALDIATHHRLYAAFG